MKHLNCFGILIQLNDRSLGNDTILLHFEHTAFDKLFGIKKNKGNPERKNNFWPMQLWATFQVL